MIQAPTRRTNKPVCKSGIHPSSLKSQVDPRELERRPIWSQEPPAAQATEPLDDARSHPGSWLGDRHAGRR